MPYVVVRRNDIDVQRRLVRIPENPPRIVLRDAPLSARQRLSHVELAVLQSQIDVDLGRVDVVVERPQQAVRVVLDVRFLSPVLIRDELFAIGPQIAVGVLKQPEVRRLRDEHAAIEHFQPARQDEAVLKHRALVHAAVVVRVFEHDNLADRRVLTLRVDVGHVAGHLDGPHAAVAVPVDHDRVLNQRLARDELDAIAGRHVRTS